MAQSQARRSWRQRVAFSAAATVLAAVPILTLGPTSPARAASTSWESKHTEEFSGSSLPNGCEAYTGKYVGGKSAWSAKNADVDGGLLNLTIEKRKLAGRAYATGGIGCWGWAQKYGKLEVRAKIPQGRGIDSYFGLWPQKGGDGAWTGVELLAPDTETAYITNGYGKKAETKRVKGEYSDAFHTYLIEWAPKYLRITMDGDELFFSQNAYTGSRWPGLVVSNGDPLTGVPDATTTLPAAFEIDRIKMFTYTGVAPKLRSETTSSSRSKVTAPASPLATIVPTAPVPAPIVTPASTAAASESESTPALAGGIWPWLLGGSLIAATAVLALNYPRHRAHQKQLKQQRERERHPTGAGRR